MASKIWASNMKGGVSIGWVEKALGAPVSLCEAGTPMSLAQQRRPAAWESELLYHHPKPPFPPLSNGHSNTLNEAENQRGWEGQMDVKCKGLSRYKKWSFHQLVAYWQRL